MSNLAVRILTAVIAGAGTVAAIILSPWGAFAFCFLVSILGIIEFFKITGVKSIGARASLLLLASFTWLEFVQLLLRALHDVNLDLPNWISGSQIFILVAVAGILLLFEKNEKDPLGTLGKLFLGYFWVFMPLALLFALGLEVAPSLANDGTLYYTQSILSFRVVLGVLFLTWTTDSMAYFGGKYLGKHKLFERISPKKTWEGSIIGLLCCLALGFGLDQWWPHEWSWMVVAAIVGTFGQLGDLVESMIKRSLDIKDSGGLLPGHGGILDRFDGMYISIPLLTFYQSLL